MAYVPFLQPWLGCAHPSVRYATLAISSNYLGPTRKKGPGQQRTQLWGQRPPNPRVKSENPRVPIELETIAIADVQTGEAALPSLLVGFLPIWPGPGHSWKYPRSITRADQLSASRQKSSHSNPGALLDPPNFLRERISPFPDVPA